MHEASLTLTADLSSVGLARRFLRESLEAWAAEGYDLAAPQVVSELATNAALHARSTYTVHLRLEADALLVEVSDSSPVRPQVRHYGLDATTGRGIALVEALSNAWGVESSPTGKTVWCRVAPDRDSRRLDDTEHGGVSDFPAPHEPAPPSGPGLGQVMALAA